MRSGDVVGFEFCILVLLSEKYQQRQGSQLKYTQETLNEKIVPK